MCLRSRSSAHLIHLIAEIGCFCASRIQQQLLAIPLDQVGTESEYTKGQGVMCVF